MGPDAGENTIVTGTIAAKSPRPRMQGPNDRCRISSYILRSSAIAEVPYPIRRRNESSGGR
jgi:hypothetical protein